MVKTSKEISEQRQPLDVWMIDPGEPGGQTSHGNAGVLSPTSLLPFNHPGLWSQLPRLLRGKNPGFRLQPGHVLPRFSALTAFLAQARPSVLKVTAQALHQLITLSRPLHQQWMRQAGVAQRFREDGWLFLYRSEQAWQTAAWARDLYNEFGLSWQVLDPPELAALEPDLNRGFAKALWVSGAASVDEPGEVVRALAHHLIEEGGVRFVRDAVLGLDQEGPVWHLATASGQRLQADRVVLALGPWARDFLRAQWGWRLPMLHERGYHQHYGWTGAGLRRPIYDTAGGYVLSPMSPGMRLTTGVELDEADAPAHSRMIEAAEAAARQVLPLGTRMETPLWLGSRPTLPDSRPILDAAPGQPGVWLALGHQHIGFSTGPGSGELIAALMLGEAAPIDPSAFAALRWGKGWLR